MVYLLLIRTIFCDTSQMVTIEMFFFYYRGNTCDVERGRRDNGYVDPGSRDIDDEIMENADDVQLKQQYHRIYKILLIV